MSEDERIVFPERGMVRVEPCPVPEPGVSKVLIRTRATLGQHRHRAHGAVPHVVAE